MKLRMKIATAYKKKKVSIGDILEVSDIMAREWVKNGYAEEVKEPKKKVKEDDKLHV